MKAVMYRVNNLRWKGGYVQRKGLIFWSNVCPCANWIDAVWAINCMNGFRERSMFE